MRCLLPCLLLGTVTAWACSVPVFRYALERWPADAYTAVVLHRGLSSEQAACVRDLGADGLAGRIAANVRVRLVDLAEPADRALKRGLDQIPSAAELPALLLYPPAMRVPEPVWRGRLTTETVSALLTSPARRELTRRLLRGDSAVWLLVEAGDPGADAAAAQLLADQLKHLEATLRLPELDPADVQSGGVGAEKLAIKFSMLRLSRTEPAEAALLGMLLNSEDDLAAARQPVAFPVFGRGRVLYALVGPGINADTIDEACRFITGACSCVVKEENPGTDLLLAADWAALVEPIITGKDEPPLGGVAGFAASPSRAAAPAKPGTVAQAIADVHSRASSGTAAPPGGVMSVVERRLGVVACAVALVLLAATWWMWRQRGG